MRILAVYIPQEEYSKIEPWIECDHVENWMEEEWLFYNPSRLFELRLRLMGYTLGVEGD